MLQITILQSVALHTSILLTEVAGEGGPHLAPQKFLLSQKFRQLMRCKKYLEKIFLSCLVWVNFKMAARGPKGVTSQVF